MARRKAAELDEGTYQSPLHIDGGPPRQKHVEIDPHLIDVPGIGPKPEDDLVASVKEYGVFEPPSVYPPDEDGRYRLKSGRRRVLAAQQVGLKRIHCMVTDERLDAAIIQISSHALRRDNPAAEFLAVDEILRERFADGDPLNAKREIERRLGLRQAKIDKLLLLRRLVPELLQGLAEDRISAGVAFQIARRPLIEDEQRLLVRILRQTGKLTAADVKALIDASTPESDDLGLDVEPTPKALNHVIAGYAETAETLLTDVAERMEVEDATNPWLGAIRDALRAVEMIADLTGDRSRLARLADDEGDDAMSDVDVDVDVQPQEPQAEPADGGQTGTNSTIRTPPRAAMPASPRPSIHSLT